MQSNLAGRASRDVLRDLTHLSLHVMLDSRVESADDADQVVRALNVLVLKMVEKSDHTAMTRSVATGGGWYRSHDSEHLYVLDSKRCSTWMLDERAAPCCGCCTTPWAATTPTQSTWNWS